MRIAIATESFLPTINGVTNSVLKILEFLDAYGHDAIVIAPQTSASPKRYLDFPVKGVPSIVFKRLMPIGIPRMAVRHLIEGFNPDVVHLASPAILGGYVARVANDLNIPILSVYQTDLAGFARHYHFSLGSNSLSRLLAIIHSNTDRTLVPSSSARDELKRLSTPNLHIWPRGVDLVRFTPEKRNEQLRLDWGASKSRKIVGYVGRIANEKSLEDLAVLDKREDIQLVLVGDGPARQKIKNILPNAIFTGFKGGEDLAVHHASFDYFIHTGRSETFCQSIQEALASGVPVVAPNSGGPLDLLTEGQNGIFFDSTSPESITQAIDTIFALDPDELSFGARESVMHRDWNSIMKELLDHYRAISRSSSSQGIEVA